MLKKAFRSLFRSVFDEVTEPTELVNIDPMKSDWDDVETTQVSVIPFDKTEVMYREVTPVMDWKSPKGDK